MTTGLTLIPFAKPSDAEVDPAQVLGVEGHDGGGRLGATRLCVRRLLRLLRPAGSGPSTVFAPTNEAFDSLPDWLLDALLEPESADGPKSVLLYRLVNGQVSSDVQPRLREIKR